MISVVWSTERKKFVCVGCGGGGKKAAPTLKFMLKKILKKTLKGTDR